MSKLNEKKKRIKDETAREPMEKITFTADSSVFFFVVLPRLSCICGKAAID